VRLGLVSIVIPVFNGGRYLRRTIDSVLSQTYRQFEVIAIDDGSTDDSLAVLAEYDDRIRVYRQANCGNVGAVRNAGIERSVGEFVAFLDQDDWWEPTKLEAQISVFRSNASIGLVHTGVCYFDQDLDREVGPQNPAGRPQDLIGCCFETLLLDNAICNSSVLIRRSATETVGACSLEIAGNTVQDYDLWLRIAQVSQIGFVNRKLTYFRLHSSQGHKDRRAMLREELRMLNRLWPQNHGPSARVYRSRIGQLLDELAVAHLDASSPWRARWYFVLGFETSRSLRAFVRCVASWAPLWILNRMRGFDQHARTVPSL
jgi:glycosyltransferase involved in cell wall biosynthesis